jgi:hypothetical protein
MTSYYKVITNIFLILMTFLHFCYAQKPFESQTNENLIKLIQFNNSGSLNMYQEMEIDAKNLYDKNQGYFAIQICSKQELTSSYYSAFANLNFLIFFLADAGIPNERIYILRSENCSELTGIENSTIIWWVSSTTFFPISIEKLHICQFNSDSIGNKTSSLKVYSKTLYKLRGKLRIASTKSIGVVLLNKAVVTSKFLRKGELLAKKILSKEIKTKKIIILEVNKAVAEWDGKKQNIFPYVYFSSINDVCK